ncbi:MAG TPA: undecaprenyl-diphosphate phosphatase [Candidatus Eremiobacteraceae bacterium]|nr:undecaprenyl-diphosphate phosphatase [Candidatus Eremiobacteraceae bacterium]
MQYLHAIALGIIQGVAELFPISSAAHTLLLSALFRWPLPSLPFVVMLHLGTFLAVLVYFARDYWRVLLGFFNGFKTGFAGQDERLALWIVIGTIPLFAIGKVAEPFFDMLFAMPIVAAIILLVTGAVLFAIERIKVTPPARPVAEDQRGPEDARMFFPTAQGPEHYEGAAALPWWQAVLIGLSQVAGLFPGGSRSGFSIAAGMLSGLSREEASRFSFLLAGPAIVGASAFEFMNIIRNVPPQPGAPTMHGVANLAAATEPHLVILTGTIVAFLSGMVAIRFFMRYVNDHKLTPFAYYCWAFGLVMLGILLSRHGS